MCLEIWVKIWHIKAVRWFGGQEYVLCFIKKIQFNTSHYDHNWVGWRSLGVNCLRLTCCTAYAVPHEYCGYRTIHRDGNEFFTVIRFNHWHWTNVFLCCIFVIINPIIVINHRMLEWNYGQCSLCSECESH